MHRIEPDRTRRTPRVSGALVAGALTFAALTTAQPAHAHEVPTPAPAFDAPSGELELLGQVKRDGVENTEMVFDGTLAFTGHNDGFRIIDVARPSAPRLVSETACRAGRHGDLSVFRSGHRRYLLQSVEQPLTAPGCEGVDTPTVTEDERGAAVPRFRFGWEGVRLFDVTRPAEPRLLHFYRTACGSHTNTLVPDRARGVMHAYVSSYPFRNGVTPAVDRDAAGELDCRAPHGKLSVIDLPLDAPQEGRVRTIPLRSDTADYDPDGPYSATGGPGGRPTGTAAPWKACHDLQAFLPRAIMVASCTSEAQVWSLAEPGDPTASDGEASTRVPVAEIYDQISHATVTWDGKVMAISDNTGASVRCDGPASVAGHTTFFPLVEPGAPAPAPLGRYIVPRPQGREFCSSNYGNVVPTRDGSHVMVQAFQQGGISAYDFSDPAHVRELAWADPETATGSSDAYATYFYNGVVYANGGVNRRNSPGALDGNRGFESYRLRDAAGRRIAAERWRSLNAQTQELAQVPRRLRRP